MGVSGIFLKAMGSEILAFQCDRVCLQLTVQGFKIPKLLNILQERFGSSPSDSLQLLFS